jgi:ribosome-associated translation inhibitor RaiA
MANLLNPAIHILDQNNEVKAYVYQQIADFEAFVTPETVVAVVARDPRKLALQLETDGHAIEPEKLKQMFRIAIVLTEQDTKIQAEGLHEDIFEAIRIAKDTLMQKLVEIQDSVVSQSDRQEQINFVLSNPQLH